MPLLPPRLMPPRLRPPPRIPPPRIPPPRPLMTPPPPRPPLASAFVNSEKDNSSTPLLCTFSIVIDGEKRPIINETIKNLKK
ncbi:MAG: hypothetical protein DRG78_10600 [Epsilonproteobacteria bacterium]|nr:MAG: hypothetical protein DRG78_10600 [Campylobacterota bacterium]